MLSAEARKILCVAQTWTVTSGVGEAVSVTRQVPANGLVVVFMVAATFRVGY
jgi:hypothetical protein